ncbi:Ger(x)C family spore germination protein [Metabacillus halosaccharovorans]|uniref:Ger(x)C family spore germination protein n=1 Tax=Metabacillus halosaccharovorans TaxID=930124 RepID=UPI000995630D|nr:Ger(x)C family spore germination protein [Metabacillus halosaccharovorans]
MTKKILLPFLALLLFLTGCWDREELDEIAIVAGIAVDKGEEKKYRMTVEVVNSAEFGKQSAQGNAPVNIYTLEGNSLSELSNKMNVGLTRKLVFSHTRVLYISEEVAREGIFGFLDFLDRSGQFRNDFSIVITSGYPASTFTKITYPVQKSPSLKLSTQIATLTDEWGGNPDVQLYDFITSLISKGINPVAGIISIRGDPEKGQSVENNKEIDPGALVLADGMAVFKGDKMVGELSLNETRGYLWTKELRSTSLSIPCDSEDANTTNKNEFFLDVRVIRSKVNLESKYKNDRPKIKVKINAEAMIQGTQCPKDLTKIDVYSDQEKLVEKFVKAEISQLIKKVQKEYEVDIFGFGDALNRQNHNKYKEVENRWDEEFAKADLDVEVDLQLLRAGIKSKSFNADIEELSE